MLAQLISFLFLVLLLSPTSSLAADRVSQDQCGSMEVMNLSQGMCEPVAMSGMPMKMAMLRYNSFFDQTLEEGSRGKNLFSVPNWLMADIGSSVGSSQYVNLDFMGTFERWTFPSTGTPELLQIGEENKNHIPYLDAQHPHSSPIMGLTLSDMLTFSEKAHLKIFFSPRGSSTDGPIPFMHRSTAEVNPDVPLGHHIGQDVGHISSTVFGTALHYSETTLELSTFHGQEPQPSKVDLPIGKLDSYAGRISQQFTPDTLAMGSIAFVKHPEADESTDHVWRYSASVYNKLFEFDEWSLQDSLVWGLVNHYDNTSSLTSLLEEILLKNEKQNFWLRAEYLQRTPAELQIASSNPDEPHWVSAGTFGYTYNVIDMDVVSFSLGASITKDFLPQEYRSAYGSNPWSGKLFLQFSGMKMWDL